VFNIVKPCKACSSFVLIPKVEKKIELRLLKEKLEEENYLINTYTGSLISTEKKCKINIYSSGKTIIKTKDSKLVEKLSKELSNILYPNELDA
tara:strand:+ start:99 stop:377 length:279 start_codon:yes stop_codon:yes gene_type:complete